MARTRRRTPGSVDVKLVDPRAKVAKKLTLKTNAASVIAFDHVLPAFADTGHWRVAMTVADKPLARTTCKSKSSCPSA